MEKIETADQVVLKLIQLLIKEATWAPTLGEGRSMNRIQGRKNSFLLENGFNIKAFEGVDFEEFSHQKPLALNPISCNKVSVPCWLVGQAEKPLFILHQAWWPTPPKFTKSLHFPPPPKKKNIVIHITTSLSIAANFTVL